MSEHAVLAPPDRPVPGDFLRTFFGRFRDLPTRPPDDVRTSGATIGRGPHPLRTALWTVPISKSAFGEKARKYFSGVLALRAGLTRGRVSSVWEVQDNGWNSVRERVQRCRDGGSLALRVIQRHGKFRSNRLVKKWCKWFRKMKIA